MGLLVNFLHDVNRFDDSEYFLFSIIYQKQALDLWYYSNEYHYRITLNNADKKKKLWKDTIVRNLLTEPEESLEMQ